MNSEFKKWFVDHYGPIRKTTPDAIRLATAQAAWNAALLAAAKVCEEQEKTYSTEHATRRAIERIHHAISRLSGAPRKEKGD